MRAISIIRQGHRVSSGGIIAISISTDKTISKGQGNKKEGGLWKEVKFWDIAHCFQSLCGKKLLSRWHHD